MNAQYKTIAQTIKTRLDAIAETGTIEQFDEVSKTGVDIAIAIEKTDPNFNTIEFIKEKHYFCSVTNNQ